MTLGRLGAANLCGLLVFKQSCLRQAVAYAIAGNLYGKIIHDVKSGCGNLYTIVAVEAASKWVEAGALPQVSG